MGQIDFSALEKAINALERGLVRALSAPGDEELRDGVIQRFEYTYELSWKMLKRQLELEMPSSSEVDGFSFRQLIREGHERGLIQDPEAWFVYRDQRNMAVEAYDNAKAESVYRTVSPFLQDTQKLWQCLQGRS